MKLAPGSSRNRRIAALVGVLAVGLTLSACDTGPSQVGAAAIVGDQRVSLDDVQTRIDTVLDRPDLMDSLKQQGRGVPDASRYIVTGAVQHELLAEAARRDGLTVNDAQIDNQIKQDGGPAESAKHWLTDQAGLRDIIRDDLMLRELARRSFGALEVGYDMVSVNTASQAKDLARRIAADPGRTQELMQAVPNGKPELGKITGGPAAASGDQSAVLQDAITAVQYYAPANSVLVINANQGPQGGGYQVVYVRSASAAPGAQPVDTSALEDSDVVTIGQYLLRPLAGELGVKISPRYGTWDPTVMQVVPASEAAAAGELLLGAAPKKS